MKVRRPQLRFRFVRVTLILIALVFILNIVLNHSSGLAGSGKNSFYNYFFRAKKPKDVKTRDEIEIAAFEAELAETTKILPKAENVRLIKVGAGGLENGVMMMRAEGPEDPVDAAMLLELSPIHTGRHDGDGGGGGGQSPPPYVEEESQTIDLNPMEKSIQKYQHSKEDDSTDPSAAVSTIQQILNAINMSTATTASGDIAGPQQRAMAIQQRYRTVLIVVAMRTRKHLDVYPTIQEWQHHCDSFEESASSPPPAPSTPAEDGDRGSTAPSISSVSRPQIVCLFALVFSSEFSNRSVAHYASLFDDDDSVMTVHTTSTMSRGGIGKLHELGFEAGVKHFSHLLKGNNTSRESEMVQIDYTILTSVQFTPVANTLSSLFVGGLVHQFEEASDVIDGPEFSRRVPGGAATRGPILGCTTVLDEMIHRNGPAAEYQGTRFVMDHGVEFLFGNGGGGVMLNAMYAVRRHAGLFTNDERIVRGQVPPAAAPSFVVTSVTMANASMLPAGVENVHGVSPFCAMMSLRVYRMVLDQHRKAGGDVQWSGGISTSGTSGARSQNGSSAVLQHVPTVVHSMIEEFEGLVSTGNHKAAGKQRPDIGDLIKLDPTFKPYVLGTDTRTAKTQLLDIALLRIARLDTVRSNLHFADVLKGSHRYKATVPFFIRYVDECVRFYNSIAPKPFYDTPRDRDAILKRLPQRFRAVEAGLETSLSLYNASTKKEDIMVASILFASRALEALRRLPDHFVERQTQTSNAVPEESYFWNLCLIARTLKVPSLISNMSVRLHQHQYMEGAILTPVKGPGGVKQDLVVSPIFQAYAKGAIMQVSSRLGGAHKQHWETALRELEIHPSFHQHPRLQVVWFTHCCHCCGFSNELQSLVHPLQHYVNVHLTAGPECFCDNAPRSLHDTLDRLYSRPQNLRRYREDDVVVYISHTNPTLYHLHKDVNPDASYNYFIGRSMYEFSRIHADHIKIANEVADEIWVPAQFVYHSYLSSGALKDKLVIVPEAIDTHAFNPLSAGKYELPPKDLFHMCNRKVTHEDVMKSYTFLSDFKWEPRKGWDVLFESYFRAFTASDNVVLFVMTHIWFPGAPDTYRWAHNITWIMEDLEHFMQQYTTLYDDPSITRARLPSFCIISQSLSVAQITTLYNSVDAFAYTTRGEGWGLPAMQAMSMGLPVMATNFGGVTEFMKPFNSFLIQLDGVVEIPQDSVYGWSFGTKWAEPSISAAVHMFRYLAAHRSHGQRVGAVARKYIVDNFSEEALGVILNTHLQRIRSKVVSRRVSSAPRQDRHQS
jgi:glycosyltransferase involved in cell wall biosynthesis